MKVNFRTIARGADSGYRTASQLVIDNPEEWASVWQQHASNIIPPPPVPGVDFTDNQVVAVFMGEKRTGGYSVEILTVETKSSEKENLASLVITVAYHQPKPGEIVPEVITHPYQIITIPQLAANKVQFKNA
ncbi:protease complex subunit PrcB family protein [Nostoc sp. FACHB-133]|uniref:protease complex subunit PrcB family protein n=1 Tax=Nostoc sp. FACHB-133 TaxID=2692835 RepID=UPI0016888D08|nr:protease complex subunit PrcB family protein [Nostoc sp. FACHB-133]MBD2526672.1 protease complex subunit PrcB family protein [Nostoc sp. FACHB-133]